MHVYHEVSADIHVVVLLLRPIHGDEGNSSGCSTSGKKKRNVVKTVHEKSKNPVISFSNGGSLSDPLNLIGIDNHANAGSVSGSDTKLSNLVRRINNVTDPLNLNGEVDGEAGPLSPMSKS